MTTAAVIGGTGLVGAQILTVLGALPAIAKVYAIARKAPKESPEKQDNVVEPESSTWTAKLASIQPPPGLFFSALGTTRGAAGGVDNQRKIDLDLNLAMAKAAKDAGTKVYVLISSGGANAASYSAYLKMKGELEEAVKPLGFDHTIILQPGLLVGPREETRLAEGILRKVANLTGYIGLKDAWAQDADVIARAAVHASLKSLNGEAPSKVWVLGGKDIIELGKTTWPPKEAPAA